ncbi:MAG: D-tyrosyl-tRNA(Tyr) deacylase, partial [Armatimonadetes bacterium]|nr:D-tyrosyl-tRNA(Tyr) deacylase [Armatimonadota bacterium]
MRAVVQRVQRASVRVGDEVAATSGHGLVVLLGVAAEDGPQHARTLADRVAHLRIFDDEAGKLNRSVLDVGGEVLAVSQFTLYGDTSGGRRPSFVRAARPEHAEPLCDAFVAALRAHGLRVTT